MSGKETVAPKELPARDNGRAELSGSPPAAGHAPASPRLFPQRFPALLPRSAHSAGAQQLLGLQRAIGNQAVTRALRRDAVEPAGTAPSRTTDMGRPAAPGRGTSPGGTIQRQVLSKLNITRIDGDPPDYMIWDVVIGGRTPSPFAGTMGAHSTAWVAHIDEVRRYIVNLPLVDAAANMILLAEEAHAHTATDAPDSLFKLKGSLSQRHQALLQSASTNLEAGIQALKDQQAEFGTSGDPTGLVRALRALINSYLTFVNYLPAATVKGGDPRGHGEGSARGDINLFEYIYALSQRQDAAATAATEGDAATDESRVFTNQELPFLTDALERLPKSGIGKKIKDAAKVAFDRSKCGSLIGELIADLWALFAAETPDQFAATHKVKRLRAWSLMLRNFLNTIRKAYPYTFDFTEMHQPEKQMTGLLGAIKDAGVSLDPGFLSELKAALDGGLMNEEAVVRGVDQYAEVAQSDLVQGGTGFQTTVLLDDTNRIGDVNAIGMIEMIGRTQSPFSGTMGAHSTAWIAHLDALRNVLLNKSPDEAIDVLIKKAGEAQQDPSLKFSNLIDENHQGLLVRAFNTLSQRGAEADSQKTGTDEVLKLQFLESYIFDYLTFVNFLPMSTVEKGGVPGGRQEGRIRKLLLSYEEFGDQAIPADERSNKAKFLQEQLWGLYDPSAVKNFPPLLGERETPQWESRPEYQFSSTETKHPLYDPIKKPRGKVSGKHEIAYERFFKTMLEAYPRATVDSGLIDSSETLSAAVKDPREAVRQDEGDELIHMLHQNNCLINAIAQAAGMAVTFDQLLDIRLRIGEIGTMLIASPRTINIIASVLGIARGIIVVYPHPIPSEEFGNTDHNPIIILHTGAAHFVPGGPEDAGNEGTGGKQGASVTQPDRRGKRRLSETGKETSTQKRLRSQEPATGEDRATEHESERSDEMDIEKRNPENTG